MGVIVLRLFIVFTLLTVVVRFMGKRQIGEMEMSEFITAFMLSELAALPITDSGIPLLFSVIPIVLLAIFEILTSWTMMHSAGMRNLISGRPTVLIRMGMIDQKALTQSRMTLSELMGELRQKTITDPADVAYAILEENGKLSVIPKESVQPPAAETLSVSVSEKGICHTLIADGKMSDAGIHLSGHSDEEVKKIMKQKGYPSPERIFLMTVNDAGEYRIIGKD